MGLKYHCEHNAMDKTDYLETIDADEFEQIIQSNLPPAMFERGVVERAEHAPSSSSANRNVSSCVTTSASSTSFTDSFPIPTTVLSASLDPEQMRLQAAAEEAAQTGSQAPLVLSELRQKILLKRAAEGKPDLPVEEFKPKQYNLTEGEKEKKEKRKEQNRRAARKCRMKKKTAEKDVFKRNDELEAEKTRLLGQVGTLRSFVDNLNAVLMAHLALCNVQLPPQENSHPEHKPVTASGNVRSPSPVPRRQLKEECSLASQCQYQQQGNAAFFGCEQSINAPAFGGCSVPTFSGPATQVFGDSISAHTQAQSQQLQLPQPPPYDQQHLLDTDTSFLFSGPPILALGDEHSLVLSQGFGSLMAGASPGSSPVSLVSSLSSGFTQGHSSFASAFPPGQASSSVSPMAQGVIPSVPSQGTWSPPSSSGFSRDKEGSAGFASPAGAAVTPICSTSSSTSQAFSTKIFPASTSSDLFHLSPDDGSLLTRPKSVPSTLPFTSSAPPVLPQHTSLKTSSSAPSFQPLYFFPHSLTPPPASSSALDLPGYPFAARKRKSVDGKSKETSSADDDKRMKLEPAKATRGTAASRRLSTPSSTVTRESQNHADDAASLNPSLRPPSRGCQSATFPPQSPSCPSSDSQSLYFVFPDSANRPVLTPPPYHRPSSYTAHPPYTSLAPTPRHTLTPPPTVCARLPHTPGSLTSLPTPRHALAHPPPSPVPGSDLSFPAQSPAGSMYGTDDDQCDKNCIQQHDHDDNFHTDQAPLLADIIPDNCIMSSTSLSDFIFDFISSSQED